MASQIDSTVVEGVLDHLKILRDPAAYTEYLINCPNAAYPETPRSRDDPAVAAIMFLQSWGDAYELIAPGKNPVLYEFGVARSQGLGHDQAIEEAKKAVITRSLEYTRTPEANNLARLARIWYVSRNSCALHIYSLTKSGHSNRNLTLSDPLAGCETAENDTQAEGTNINSVSGSPADEQGTTTN